ncbi:MAG: hypothetical protein RLZZ505_1005 [Verrucomicrobiota bacterium]|jgi:hypothetical protein
MFVYLDICCFNRPFDNQTQLRVRLEAEAKLSIQEKIREGTIKLAWSYMIDFENSANPFEERRNTISKWRGLATKDTVASPEIIATAEKLNLLGFGKKDSIHLACAIATGCDCFLTTDDAVLKRRLLVNEIAILNPLDYVASHDD